MATYRISGIWNVGGAITHYAMHEVKIDHTTRAVKTTKADAIKLLDSSANKATTWMWDYSISGWKVGNTVEVVNSVSGKYLRSNPDNTLTDNLKHLIDYDWLPSI